MCFCCFCSSILLILTDCCVSSWFDLTSRDLIFLPKTERTAPDGSSALEKPFHGVGGPLEDTGSYLSLPSSLLARWQAASGFSCRESRQSHRSVLLVALLRPQRTSKGVGTHRGFNDQEALPVAKNRCDQQLLAPTAASEIKTEVWIPKMAKSKPMKTCSSAGQAVKRLIRSRTSECP